MAVRLNKHKNSGIAAVFYLGKKEKEPIFTAC